MERMLSVHKDLCCTSIGGKGCLERRRTTTHAQTETQLRGDQEPGHLHASTPAVNGNSIEGTEAMVLMTGTGSYYAASSCS